MWAEVWRLDFFVSTHIHRVVGFYCPEGLGIIYSFLILERRYLANGRVARSVFHEMPAPCAPSNPHVVLPLFPVELPPCVCLLYQWLSFLRVLVLYMYLCPSTGIGLAHIRPIRHISWALVRVLQSHTLRPKSWCQGLCIVTPRGPRYCCLGSVLWFCLTEVYKFPSGVEQSYCSLFCFLFP